MVTLGADQSLLSADRATSNVDHVNDVISGIVVGPEGLTCTIDELDRAGYDVWGPAVRDGAIVTRHFVHGDELPMGVAADQAPGSYRLVETGDRSRFGWAVGPHSWKPLLHPASVVTMHLTQAGRDQPVTVSVPGRPSRPLALFGLRPCDLAGLDTLDHVLIAAAPSAEPTYHARRVDAFLVVVNCAVPAATCCCTSFGTGPHVDDRRRSHDIEITELVGPDPAVDPDYVIRAVSERGVGVAERVADQVAHRAISEADVAAVAAQRTEASAAIDRTLPTDRVREALTVGHDLDRWGAVADLCLACGNCTSVCPTCFCTTIEDVGDLSGTKVERRREWESCFSLEFSRLGDHSVRASVGVAISAVDDPQARDLARPVRRIGLCRVRTVHDLVPGRYRLRRGRPGHRRGRGGAMIATLVQVDVPMPYRIVARDEETSDVVTLRVQPVVGDLPGFRPAQFSMIGVMGVGEVPISISSACDDRTAHGYTLRRAGAVTNALWDRRIGDVVTVRGPFGRPWDLARADGRHAVVVAGGIGIAPLRAAIDELFSGTTAAPRRLSVLVGAATPSDHLYRSWLDDLSERGVEVLRAVDRTGDTDDWPHAVGFVTELIAPVVAEWTGNVDVAAYVCGPDAMMSATIETLSRCRVAIDDIEVTLERNMQCANGWCGHCQLGPLLVCRDGPVATAAELGDLLERSEL